MITMMMMMIYINCVGLAPCSVPFWKTSGKMSRLDRFGFLFQEGMDENEGK